MSAASTFDPGTADAQQDRADTVRRMFGAIAGGYDRSNSVLSFGMHHLWRRETVRSLGLRPTDRVLDCCCGTGDLSFSLAARLGPGGEVVGTDFTPEMVEGARRKAQRRRSAGASLSFSVADMMALPFPDHSFDAASVAFGIRNVVDPVAGLSELRRVVRPGGRIAVLEFGQPDGLLFGPLYRGYSRFIMPRIGGLLTGNREAYEYLPRTAAAFPAGPRFVEQILLPAGLAQDAATPLSFGITWNYVGRVPAALPSPSSAQERR